MKITPITFLQYKYGKYITSLNIHREVYYINEVFDFKRLSKLKKRIGYIQRLMPSPQNNDFEGIIPYNIDDELRNDDTVYYTNRHGIPQFGKAEKGGTLGFIKKVHSCCLEYLDLLSKIEINETKTVTSELLNQEKISERSLSKMYRFLNEYFIINCKEDEFTDLHNTNKILIRSRDRRLSIKRITKSMVGVLFGFIIEENDYLYSRLLFEHTRSKDTVKVDYEDALRVLKNSRLKDRNGSLNIFEKNLSNAYKSFLD